MCKLKKKGLLEHLFPAVFFCACFIEILKILTDKFLFLLTKSVNRK